jgi:hypothetical protein
MPTTDQLGEEMQATANEALDFAKELRALREALAKLNPAPAAPVTRRLPIEIGTKLFIRTVTAHFTGRVTRVSEEEVELEEAAWIADDGRFADAMKTGEFNEVEPYPDDMLVRLFRSTFLDQVVWPHQLPRVQK